MNSIEARERAWACCRSKTRVPLGEADVSSKLSVSVAERGFAPSAYQESK